MANTGLPVSTYVSISTAIAAGGVLRTQFGIGLLITTDSELSAGGDGKVELFRNNTAVQSRFDDGTVRDDAAVWFSADPPPKSLYIGRWATVDVDTQLHGATVTAPPDSGALDEANASFRFLENDVNVNLSGADSYGAIATALTNALRTGALTGVAINASGSSYQVGDVLTLAGGDPVVAAQVTVLTVNGSGAVQTIEISNPGSGYTSDPTGSSTGGNGSGATFDTFVRGAIDTRLAGATFSFGDNRFTLDLGSAAELSETTFGTAESGGTDISSALGFASGTEYLQGSASETLSQAVATMVERAPSGSPVALMLGTDCPLNYGADNADTRDELAAFAQAGDYIYALLDTSDQVLESSDTSSHAARAFSASQSKVLPVYSKAGERPDIGMLALLSAQNLNNPSSIITTHLKALPGVETTFISETQRAALESKRCNAYTRVGGLPSLIGGFTGKAGTWADAQWWLLWIKAELENQIYNAMRASRRFNTAILTDTIHEVMLLGVRNGGIQQGGTVNSSLKQDIIAVTGNSEFSGVLSTGYLAWVEQPNARSALDRENRIGRFKVWISPADAIHRVIGDVVLSGG